jgi:hypothetical protein
MTAPAHRVLTLVAGMIAEAQAITDAAEDTDAGPSSYAARQPTHKVKLTDTTGVFDVVRMAGGEIGGMN